jgi:hypothetical protein
MPRTRAERYVRMRLSGDVLDKHAVVLMSILTRPLCFYLQRVLQNRLRNLERNQIGAYDRKPYGYESLGNAHEYNMYRYVLLVP